MDGFGQDFEFVALGAGAFKKVGGCCLSGEEQDLAGRQEATNMDGGFDAVHVGHDDVADDEVGADFPCGVHRARSGIDSGGIKPSLIENDGERVGYHPFVVNYQYTRSLLLRCGHSVSRNFNAEYPFSGTAFQLSYYAR
jgi:hypothetical protein